MVNDKMISDAVTKMIFFYNGSLHDIEHFLKVWAYARTIGRQEELDDDLQETLEFASIVHDIACPLCRKKYGNTNGNHQEEEGVPLTKDFYKGFAISEKKLNRICFLVGHHHTYTDIDGLDYQILLEADFLVNASESRYSRKEIESFRKNVFKTESGLKLLNNIYQLQ
jgi:uncharacterized protein